MRLFRRKKNNRGFSLVETVCAVAIIGLTSTAIGSAMIMSTDNYQRGNTEVDVQKEAQLATNLIGNLLVDATDASYTGNTLTIYGEGIEYEIVYDPATKKLTYKETKGASVTTGTLAENVTNFKPNLDNWDNMNARIDMAIEKNGRNYEASYNTTARNAASFNVGSAESAFVICETELVLEPGQVYDLPVAIYGNPDVPGVDLVKAQSSLTGANLGTTSLDDYDDGITIEVGDDASGIFTFVVETAAKETGTNIALDAKTVTVKIRRATSISKNVSVAGTECTAGATYQIAATVAADYPDKIIGKEYDNDYKDPRKVAFNVVDDGTVTLGVDYSVTMMDGQVKVTLINDLPQDSKITVNMNSMHSFGTNNANKTGHAYDTTVKDSYVIENTQSAVWLDSGIMRGNDNFAKEFCTSLILDGDYSIKGQFGGEPKWYFRYRIAGSNDTTWKYYRNVDNSLATKFNASETKYWLPDYAYEIDMICMSISKRDDGKYYMEYPQDESLLAELQTQWPSIPLLKGWTDDDLNKSLKATSFNQYGGRLVVGKTEIYYDKNGTYVNTYGSHTDPYVMTKNTGEVSINVQTSNLTRGHYSYSYKVYKYNTNSQKYDIPVTSLSNIITIQFDNSTFKFSDFKTNNDGTAKGPGNYVFVPSVVGNYNDIDGSSNLIDGYKMADQGQGTWALADKDTGHGCFYFEIR